MSGKNVSGPVACLERRLVAEIQRVAGFADGREILSESMNQVEETRVTLACPVEGVLSLFRVCRTAEMVK